MGAVTAIMAANEMKVVSNHLNLRIFTIGTKDYCS